MFELTKEQYEALTPFEQNLRNAYHNSFVSMSGSDFAKVAEIFDQVAEKPLTRSQRSCSACRLRALKQLGEAYENYEKGKRETEKKKTNRGRPRKLSDDADGSGEA